MSENAGGTTPIFGRSKAAMLIALNDTSDYQSVYQCQWSVRGFGEADAVICRWKKKIAVRQLLS
jgi:hypothetical protein